MTNFIKQIVHKSFILSAVVSPSSRITATKFNSFKKVAIKEFGALTTSSTCRNAQPHTFNVLKDVMEHDTSSPSFMKMPIQLPNGEQGLLAKGELGEAVKDLPLYDIKDISDQRLLS
ncbi:20634_t:CDS:2, partial [Dentiscutata erythropus]